MSSKMKETWLNLESIINNKSTKCLKQKKVTWIFLQSNTNQFEEKLFFTCSSSCFQIIPHLVLTSQNIAKLGKIGNHYH